MARGGYREGAGRPSGSTNKSSTEQSQRLSELDRAYGKPAVKEERDSVDLPPVVIQLTGPRDSRI